MMLKFCGDITAEAGPLRLVLISVGCYVFPGVLAVVVSPCVCTTVFVVNRCFLCLFPDPAQPRTVFPVDSSGKNLISWWTPLELNHATLPDFHVLWGRVASGAEYQDIEVHLRRQKSGFGFRVLGGDEAGQPVSPETREKARMAMGVEPCHFLLSNPLHTHCVHLTPDL